MPIPDNPSYNDLKTFHDSQNIAFRAACNAVAPAASQPIKQSWIETIRNTSDAENIQIRLWDARGPVSHAEFADLLSQDLSWKTLVLEKLRERSRWSELWVTLKSDKTLDKIKAAFEKAWDGHNHPAAKTASTILLSIVGLGVTSQLITVPIKPVLSKDATGVLPLRFEVGDLKPLKLQLQPPDGNPSIPVDFRLNPPREPIGLTFSGSTDATANIKDLALQLSATNKAMIQATGDLHALSLNPIEVDTGTLNDSLKKISTNLEATTAKMSNLSSDMANLNTRLSESAVAQLKASQEQSASIKNSVLAVSRAANHGAITLTLKKGVPKPAILPFQVGDSGLTSTTTVDLTAIGMGTNTQGRYLELSVRQEKQPPRNLFVSENASEIFLVDPAYRISLVSTTRNWKLNRVAEIALTQQAK